MVLYRLTIAITCRLSLSQAIIIDHGGNLRVESEKGYGTVVLVEFPAERTTDDAKRTEFPIEKSSSTIEFDINKVEMEKATSNIGSELVDYFD